MLYVVGNLDVEQQNWLFLQFISKQIPAKVLFRPCVHPSYSDMISSLWYKSVKVIISSLLASSEVEIVFMYDSACLDRAC